MWAVGREGVKVGDWVGGMVVKVWGVGVCGGG